MNANGNAQEIPSGVFMVPSRQIILITDIEPTRNSKELDLSYVYSEGGSVPKLTTNKIYARFHSRLRPGSSSCRDLVIPKEEEYKETSRRHNSEPIPNQTVPVLKKLSSESIEATKDSSDSWFSGDSKQSSEKSVESEEQLENGEDKILDKYWYTILVKRRKKVVLKKEAIQEEQKIVVFPEDKAEREENVDEAMGSKKDSSDLSATNDVEKLEEQPISPIEKIEPEIEDSLTNVGATKTMEIQTEDYECENNPICSKFKKIKTQKCHKCIGTSVITLQESSTTTDDANAVEATDSVLNDEEVIASLNNMLDAIAELHVAQQYEEKKKKKDVPTMLPPSWIVKTSCTQTCEPPKKKKKKTNVLMGWNKIEQLQTEKSKCCSSDVVLLEPITKKEDTQEKITEIQNKEIEETLYNLPNLEDLALGIPDKQEKSRLAMLLLQPLQTSDTFAFLGKSKTVFFNDQSTINPLLSIGSLTHRQNKLELEIYDFTKKALALSLNHPQNTELTPIIYNENCLFDKSVDSEEKICQTLETRSPSQCLDNNSVQVNLFVEGISLDIQTSPSCSDEATENIVEIKELGIDTTELKISCNKKISTRCSITNDCGIQTKKEFATISGTFSEDSSSESSISSRNDLIDEVCNTLASSNLSTDNTSQRRERIPSTEFKFFNNGTAESSEENINNIDTGCQIQPMKHSGATLTSHTLIADYLMKELVKPNPPAKIGPMSRNEVPLILFDPPPLRYGPKSSSEGTTRSQSARQDSKCQKDESRTKTSHAKSARKDRFRSVSPRKDEVAKKEEQMVSGLDDELGSNRVKKPCKQLNAISKKVKNRLQAFRKSKQDSLKVQETLPGLFCTESIVNASTNTPWYQQISIKQTDYAIICCTKCYSKGSCRCDTDDRKEERHKWQKRRRTKGNQNQIPLDASSLASSFDASVAQLQKKYPYPKTSFPNDNNNSKHLKVTSSGRETPESLTNTSSTSLEDKKQNVWTSTPRISHLGDNSSRSAMKEATDYYLVPAPNLSITVLPLSEELASRKESSVDMVDKEVDVCMMKPVVKTKCKKTNFGRTKGRKSKHNFFAKTMRNKVDACVGSERLPTFINLTEDDLDQNVKKVKSVKFRSKLRSGFTSKRKRLVGSSEENVGCKLRAACKKHKSYAKRLSGGENSKIPVLVDWAPKKTGEMRYWSNFSKIPVRKQEKRKCEGDSQNFYFCDFSLEDIRSSNINFDSPKVV